MSETIQLGDIEIKVTRKSVKHAHLSVHPPSGKVTLVAPDGTRPEVARAFAISKLGWIREQQFRMRQQAREAPRRFIERESHDLWGRRHLLAVRYRDGKPSVALDHRRITLTVRPHASAAKRAEVIHEWHKSLLHNVIPALIRKCPPKVANLRTNSIG
jgi:predicted metal-dependent hydrolase